MLLKVAKVLWDLPDKLINIRLLVVVIFCDEHVFSQFGNLQESFGSHILYTRMLFMHKLVKFLDNSPQEGPVTA